MFRIFVMNYDMVFITVLQFLLCLFFDNLCDFEFTILSIYVDLEFLILC